MNLNKFLKEKGLLPRELAKLSGVSQRTIEYIAYSDGNCNVSTAIKLAKALKVTLDELCLSKEDLEEILGPRINTKEIGVNPASFGEDKK